VKRPYQSVTRAAKESAAVVEQFCQNQQADSSAKAGNSPPSENC